MKRLFEWAFGKKEEPIDTLKELARFRRVDVQIEAITKLLKCNPNEMIPKIVKIQAHVAEMQNTLRTAHVSNLIEKVHKNCSKHEGPTCKKCDKCLDFECEKCQSVDWLRKDVGIEPLLLTKINMPQGG